MADFRQYYGIDLPLAPEDVGCERWAMLWHALPRESRCVQRLVPEARWTAAEYMINDVRYYLNVLAWHEATRDGQKGRNPPSPERTPAERARAERRRDNALAARSEIDAILGI